MFYCFYSCYVCVRVWLWAGCFIIRLLRRGTHHWFSPWTPLSFLGRKITIRSEVAPHTCCALIASEFLVLTESRRNWGRNTCCTGMCNEWRSPSGLKESSCGVRLWAPNEDWFSELHCSINRDYNKWGNWHSKRQVVSGEWVSPMLPVNPSHISQMPLLLSLLSCVI